MATATGQRTQPSINVTPLIDVLLVLLILFMVIQPSAQHGLDALLPKPTLRGGPVPDATTLLVRVAGAQQGGLLYSIDDVAVPAESFPAILRHRVSSSRVALLFVQADSGLDYKPVLDVVNQAHAAGIQVIGLVPSPK